MNNGREVNLKTNKMKWVVTLCLMLIGLTNYAQKTDSLPIKVDTLRHTDTLTIKTSKDSLDAPVKYSATDSIVIDVPAKKAILYNNAKAIYQDMDMQAYKIEIDQPKRLVNATHTLDSTGKMIGQPKFVQGENNMRADSITYNIDTKKGITKSTYTNQGEMFVYGETIKKISDDSYFALRGRFTTCNLDTPHFAFVANKMKLVNKKVAISGPVHPEFEGVPVPIYLPFGFFPINQGRHSGLLPPQFSTNEQFGLGLEGLGYYKVLNDHFDATLRTNIYSYGGYLLNLSSKYIMRYRYAGNLNLSYQNVRILSDFGTKEFTSTRVFNIGWSHSMDSKARPGTTFNAHVNAGSTKFNQYIANNPSINFQNQLTSSITYSKTTDKYNFTVSANHNQNSINRLVNLDLPNITFTVNPFYPLQSKELVGEPKWYQKLQIGLNSSILSNAAFYDSAFNFKRLIDTVQWGAEHRVPLQFTFPSLGPFQIAPGIGYTERWYDRQFIRSWNAAAEKVDTTIAKGFYTARDVSFNLGINLNTALYGIYNFRTSSNVKAIRHVLRPEFSLNYKPDLSSERDFYTTQIDTTGRTQRFSKYDGTRFGAFGSGGRFAGFSFGIDNNLEMKRRSKDSSAQDRKIMLIQTFSIKSNYNLLADSFKLAPFAISLNSGAIFDKINITANANLDPYQVDSTGFRINKYTWSGGNFSPGRITNGSIAISANFQSKQKEEHKKPTTPENNIPLTAEEQQNELNYIRTHPAEFADFNIPWSFNVSYSLTFNRVFKPDYSGFRTEIFSSANLSGDFNLSPKWKLGMQTYYDIKSAKIQSLSMSISRDMHCWQMSINVVPVGPYRSFSIMLNPKSGILRDLRINRSRSFYGGL